MGPKEAGALTEALAIHYSLTVAANNNALTLRANKAIAALLKNEHLLKAVFEVSCSVSCMPNTFASSFCNFFFSTVYILEESGRLMKFFSLRVNHYYEYSVA